MRKREEQKNRKLLYINWTLSLLIEVIISLFHDTETLVKLFKFHLLLYYPAYNCFFNYSYSSRREPRTDPSSWAPAASGMAADTSAAAIARGTTMVLSKEATANALPPQKHEHDHDHNTYQNTFTKNFSFGPPSCFLPTRIHILTS